MRFEARWTGDCAFNSGSSALGSSPGWRHCLVSANCSLVIKSLFFVFPCSQETENNILDAEPLVGKGVGAALFLASKKGIKLIMF